MNDSSTASKGSAFLFLAACAAFMLVGIMTLAWLGTAPVHDAVGKQIPEIHIEPLFPDRVEQPFTGRHGTALVLYLWGPWNSESCQGLQEFATLYQRFRGNPRIQWVSVAIPKDELDVDELRKQVQDATAAFDVDIPTYFDPSGKTSIDLALLMPYGSMGFPTTIVAEESGRAIRVIEGYQADSVLELERFLAEYLTDH